MLTKGCGVAWNGKLFVAVGEGINKISYSANGINWTGVSTDIFTVSGYKIAWNGKLFVAVGEGTNSIAYSYDGITNWVGLGTTIITKGYGIVWNGSKFVVVGEGINTFSCYSSDGITWINTISTTAYYIWNNVGINSTNVSLSLNIGRSVSWTEGKFIAVGDQDSTHPNTIAFSPDGSLWIGLGSTIFTNADINASGLGIAYASIKEENSITINQGEALSFNIDTYNSLAQDISISVVGTIV